MKRLHLCLFAGTALLSFALAGCAHDPSVMPDFVANKPVLGFDPLKDPIPPADELRDLGFSEEAIAELLDPTAGPTETDWRDKVSLFHVPGSDGPRVVLATVTGTEHFWSPNRPKAGDLEGRVTQVRPVGWLPRFGMLHSLDASGLHVGCEAGAGLGHVSFYCHRLVRFANLERLAAHWGPLETPEEIASRLAAENRAGRFSQELADRLLSIVSPTPEQQALLDQSDLLRARSQLEAASSKNDFDFAGRTVSRVVDRLEPTQPFRAASMRFVAGVVGEWETDRTKAHDRLLELARSDLPPFVIHVAVTPTNVSGLKWSTPSSSAFAASGPVLRDWLWTTLFNRSVGTSQPPDGAFVVSLGAPSVEVARIQKKDGAVQDVERQVEVVGPREQDLPRIERIRSRLAEIDGALAVQRGRLGTYSGDEAARGVVADRTTPGLKPAPSAQWQGGGESGSAAWRKASAGEEISKLESERENLQAELARLSAPARHTTTVTTREYVNDATVDGFRTTTTIPIELRAPDGTVVSAQSVVSDESWSTLDREKDRTVESMKERAQKYPQVSWTEVWKLLGPVVTAHVNAKTAALSDETERALARYFLARQETPGPWLDTVFGAAIGREAAPAAR